MAAQEPASSEPRKKAKADRMGRAMGEGGEKGPKRKKKGSGSKKSREGVAPAGAGTTPPSSEVKGKVKKAAPPPPPRPPSPAWFKMVVEDFIKFLKAVRAEMKRVTWPSGKEVRVATVVVLMTLLVVTGYIAVVNYVLTLIFTLNSHG